MFFSVQQIQEFIQGRVENEVEIQSRISEIRVDRPSELGRSHSTDLAYFFSRAFEKDLATAQPGILITAPPFVEPLKASGLPLWKSTVVISCRDPYYAMALLSEKFAPHLSAVAHVPQGAGRSQASRVHPSSIIGADTKMGEGVQIGPFCVIENGVEIGRNSVIHSGCTIGPGCKIGEETVLFPGVTLYEFSVLGSRVRLHAGTVIGSDGFGYAPRKVSGRVTDHQKIYHLGRVVIEDDVEIGANSCVDRGTIGDTRIGSKAKLDNQVHIGHNAQLDEGAIICGGTCLAGNASVGKFAYVGGLTGIGNHVHVGDGANVGALTMVTKDVPAGGTAVGNPQREYREHFRAHAHLNKLLVDRRSK